MRARVSERRRRQRRRRRVGRQALRAYLRGADAMQRLVQLFGALQGAREAPAGAPAFEREDGEGQHRQKCFLSCS